MHSARTRTSEHVEPIDLLLSLWHDETLAFDLLTNATITPQSMLSSLAPHIAVEVADMLFAEQSMIDAAASPIVLAHSQQTEDALKAAHQLARRQGRHVEVGTVHLLWGVMNECDDVRKLLTDAGLSIEQVTLSLDIPADSQGTPLPIDVDLQLTDPDAGERHNILRILDATANRAREGVRVVEDHARFISNDESLTAELKQFRHDLAAACRKLPIYESLAARDTRADVGTTVSTSSEQSRRSADDVLRANLKRIEESLRSLEEYGKVIDRELGPLFEALRYRAYTIEQRVLSSLNRGDTLANRCLYLLLTPSQLGEQWEQIAEQALEGGVDIIQLREKEMPDRSLLEIANRLRQLTTQHNTLLIINDRADICMLSKADGVHLGQDDMTVAQARRIIGTNGLIGVSTHTIDQANQAVVDGADYIGVGPMFPSTTKQFESFPGVEFARQVHAEIHLPWFAIGGITNENLNKLTAAGCTRVAVSGAVCQADDAARAASEFIKSLPTT